MVVNVRDKRTREVRWLRVAVVRGMCFSMVCMGLWCRFDILSGRYIEIMVEFARFYISLPLPLPLPLDSACCAMCLVSWLRSAPLHAGTQAQDQGRGAFPIRKYLGTHHSRA